MSQGFFFGEKKMTKYYPEALTLLVETNTDDVSYKRDPSGPTYVRYDMMPEAHPSFFLFFSVAALFSCLSSLLTKDFVEAAILAAITAIFVWRQWRVMKQWQAIQDALPD
jgi:hypothetical protein